MIQDFPTGGTERVFLRRQKAIEADENRRSNMIVEKMLEKDLLYHSSDDAKTEKSANLKRKCKTSSSTTDSNFPAQSEKNEKAIIDLVGKNDVGQSFKKRKDGNVSTKKGLRTKGKKSSKAADEAYSEDIEGVSDSLDDAADDDDDDMDDIKETSAVKSKTTSTSQRGSVAQEDVETLAIDKILAIRMKPPTFTAITSAASSSSSSIKNIEESGTTPAENSIESIQEKTPAGIDDKNLVANNQTVCSAVVKTADTSQSTVIEAMDVSDQVEMSVASSSRELLVKFSGKSYRALAWIDEEVMKRSETGENKLKGFLRVFKRKGEPALEAVTANSAPFSLESLVDFDWLEIERIVTIYNEVVGAQGSLNKCTDSDNDMNLCASGKAKKSDPQEIKTADIAFVKWRGLGYSECTWEFWSEVQNEEHLIAQCREKEKEVEALLLKNEGKSASDKRNQNLDSRTSAISGGALGREDIPVRNVTLRDYQLQGINWLLFQWTQSRSCLLADEMGLGEYCLFRSSTSIAFRFYRVIQNTEYCQMHFLTSNFALRSVEYGLITAVHAVTSLLN